MTYADWAEALARNLLAEPLPRRWAHSQGVAATARTLAPMLRGDAELVTAAAWLHDIGYTPHLHATGFHPLDGARYLRDIHHADLLLCRLVAHHSCAINEATERGLAADLASEFTPAPPDLADALIYCDMTTSPDGHRTTVEHRLSEIRARYGPGHAVTRAIARSAPELTSAVSRVTRKLAGTAPCPGPAVPVVTNRGQPMMLART
jgi:HD domain